MTRREKRLQPGEVLRRPGEEHIFVGDRERRPVDQADAGDERRPASAARCRAPPATSFGRRHELDAEVAVAGHAADRADEVGEGAHRIEPAPDQPLLVGDERADAMLDVEEASRPRMRIASRSVGRLISSFWASATSLIRRAPGLSLPEAICSRSASATRLTSTSRDDPEPLIFSVRSAISWRSKRGPHPYCVSMTVALARL